MTQSWEPFGRVRAEAEPPSAAPPSEPAKKLAIVACMDCRVDPLAALGLRLGDAVVLRNAGAHVTDDVVRSLALARDGLGVEAVRIVGHTDCAAQARDDAATAAVVRHGCTRARSALPGLTVEGAVLDLRSGHLAPVT